MLGPVEVRGHHQLRAWVAQGWVLGELPGVTLESSQTWTRGGAQSRGERCFRQGEQCVQRHRGGAVVRLTPAWQGLECQVQDTRLGLYSEVVGAMEGSKQRKGVAGTKRGARGQLGAAAAAQRRDNPCSPGPGGVDGPERREAEVMGGTQAEQDGTFTPAPRPARLGQQHPLWAAGAPL